LVRLAEGRTIGGVQVQVVYFDGCPSWRTATERLREALALIGQPDAAVGFTLVETEEEAAAAKFAGSPTILVDGQDLFLAAGAVHSLASRLYSTSQGLAGSRGSRSWSPR
jgi:hypothetical protein